MRARVGLGRLRASVERCARAPRPIRAAALVLVAAAYAGCAEDSPTSTYTIAGHVTDAATGDGVGGARVRFVSDTLYTEAVKTSSSGHYQMMVESDVLFGQVRAERSGYTPAETTVYFDTPSRRIDLVLKAAPAEAP
jgi:hypothetical protein